MKADYRLKTTLLALAALLTIGFAGCAAARQAYSRGSRAEFMKDFDKAMTEYKAALDKEPGNTE